MNQFDNSSKKRDCFEVYHQQGVNKIDPDEKVELMFGENNSYHQIGNAYL